MWATRSPRRRALSTHRASLIEQRLSLTTRRRWVPPSDNVITRSSPSRSTRARDQAFSPVSALGASIAAVKEIVVGGEGTMLRKTAIAISTTAAIGAAVALAPAVASARGGGGGHGGGGHGGGGHGGGGHGGGGHGGAM